MLELSPLRKNKINLSDYNCVQDIDDRIYMSDFTTLDVEILEEIIYSPLKISFKKLIKSIDCNETEAKNTIEKFSLLGLLKIEGDLLFIDKDKRKYFEFEINRFSSDFKPDMEFIQAMLKKVPIQVLPLWYSIPRSSDNIFESILEKYLYTPHIYNRYLQELGFNDPIINGIIHDVFHAPDFKISSTDLISKYNLKRRDFEEMILLLEFNFVACLCYEKVDDHWEEYVAPFHEWHEYLRFLKRTEAPIIHSKVEVQYDSDFAFVEQMSELLLKAKNKPFSTEESKTLQKILLLGLGVEKSSKLHITDAGDAWLDLSLDNRALTLYRHPHNRLLEIDAQDRQLRECEKTIKRVLHGGWVFFEDFIKGVMIPLTENSVVQLKKTGKNWKYTLPIYSDDEKLLIKSTVLDWLFEAGMVKKGTYQNKECFALTAFGRFFFDD